MYAYNDYNNNNYFKNSSPEFNYRKYRFIDTNVFIGQDDPNKCIVLNCESNGKNFSKTITTNELINAFHDGRWSGYSRYFSHLPTQAYDEIRITDINGNSADVTILTTNNNYYNGISLQRSFNFPLEHDIPSGGAVLMDNGTTVSGIKIEDFGNWMPALCCIPEIDRHDCSLGSVYQNGKYIGQYDQNHFQNTLRLFNVGTYTFDRQTKEMTFLPDQSRFPNDHHVIKYGRLDNSKGFYRYTHDDLVSMYGTLAIKEMPNGHGYMRVSSAEHARLMQERMNQHFQFPQSSAAQPAISKQAHSIDFGW